MNMKSLHPIFILIFCLYTFSLAAQDQIMMSSISKGLSLGAHAAYISHENDVYHAKPEKALGYGLRIQYGFNHKMAVAISYQHYSIKPKSINSNVNRYPLFEYDIIGEYIFGSSVSRLRPNLQAGFNFTNTEESYHYQELGVYTNVNTTEEYYAIAFLAGAGLSYYFSPNISADLTINVHTGQFNKVYLTTNYTPTEKIDIQSDLFDLNGLLGFQYHF